MTSIRYAVKASGINLIFDTQQEAVRFAKDLRRIASIHILTPAQNKLGYSSKLLCSLGICHKVNVN